MSELLHYFVLRCVTITAGKIKGAQCFGCIAQNLLFCNSSDFHLGNVAIEVFAYCRQETAWLVFCSTPILSYSCS